MTDIRRNDLKPKEFLGLDEGYTIKIKNLDTGLTTIIDSDKDSVLEFFKRHGYVPVWKRWDVPTKRWRNAE